MRVTGFSVKNLQTHIQAQKEEQPKETAPRKRRLDSLSDWPGFRAVKR